MYSIVDPPLPWLKGARQALELYRSGLALLDQAIMSGQPSGQPYTAAVLAALKRKRAEVQERAEGLAPLPNGGIKEGWLKKLSPKSKLSLEKWQVTEDPQ